MSLLIAPSVQVNRKISNSFKNDRPALSVLDGLGCSNQKMGDIEKGGRTQTAKEEMRVDGCISNNDYIHVTLA